MPLKTYNADVNLVVPKKTKPMNYRHLHFKLNLLLFIVLLFGSCQKDEILYNEDIEVILDETIDEVSKNDLDTKPEDLDAHLNWIYEMQGTSGLLESAENTDFVSLYDNALAAILFIQQGNPERAEKIFDFYNSKKETELITNGGFYQSRNSSGEKGERIWMGDNAWLLIALNHYEATYRSNKYESLSNALDNWLRSMQNEDGSIKGGVNSDGSIIPKVTEGILMAFNAVKGYDDFHKGILNFLHKNRWDNTLGVLTSWPENPQYKYAMDLHPLGNGVFQDMPDDVLFQANRYLNSQNVTVTGEEITGYCFDDDKDVIWLEGTAQMAVAFASIGRFDKSETLIETLEKTLLNSTTVENAQGIPYASNHGTSYGNSMLWDHADIAPALSSTIWYSFAKLGFNPLHLGRKYDIPDGDMFWIANN